MRHPVIRILPLLFLAFLPAAADDDPWQPVRDLVRGSELRVYRVGVRVALAAKFDRASEDSLIITTKEGQISILKDEIQRLECRRAGGHFKNTRAERTIPRQGAEITSNTMPGATTTVKTGLELPLKSTFYTVYERPGKSPDETASPQR